MEKIECRVRFVTPAFLGNAEQKGQWRTPPFKALLREWWRVAAAREYDYDHTKLREAEGLLFGHAWLNEPGSRNKTWAMQGQVRLRLDRWEMGTLSTIPSANSAQMVCHANVDLSKVNLPDHIKRRFYCEQHQCYHKVDPFVYLGFGPHTTKGLAHTAIGPNNESIDMALLFATTNSSAIRDTLNLIHWFGTIGGRSRNSWGSMKLEKIDDYTPPPMDDLLSGAVLPQLVDITRPLRDCLQNDWPHALGADQQGAPLLWKSTNCYDNWSHAMQELARVKIAFRTTLDVPVGKAGDRHILAYPVTHHRVNAWLENGKDVNRLANQLRFKVVQDSRNRYWCLAYHLPCGLPEMLQQKLGQNRIDDKTQLRVWQTVHNKLNSEMQRIIQGGRS